jgi:hypothetical protein
MDDERRKGASPNEEYEHGRDAERADEPATPGDIGALDGAAAVGSAGAVGDSSDADEEGGIPSKAPDPSVGPD